jgi:hypothetical protein
MILWLQQSERIPISFRRLILNSCIWAFSLCCLEIESGTITHTFFGQNSYKFPLNTRKYLNFGLTLPRDLTWMMAYSDFDEFHLLHGLLGWLLPLGLYQRACFGSRRKTRTNLKLRKWDWVRCLLLDCGNCCGRMLAAWTQIHLSRRILNYLLIGHSV